MPKIDIYSKNFCPYCVQAKNLLNELNIEFKEHDITATPDAIQELVKKSGIMSVPQIFVDDKFIGGYDDIAALHDEDKLVPLLKGE